MKINKSRRGFTLVEILLSLSMLSVMVVLLVSMVGTLTQMRETAHAKTILRQDGIRIVELINRIGRNAELVNMPSVQTASSSLSIDIFDTNLSPTIFLVNDGVLTMKKGSSVPVVLNSGMSVVTDFSCTNTSLADTPGSFECALELQYANTSNKGYLNIKETFYAAASLR
jgi:prepilin-type N-terminal cleavage/methylation domain-containing protein